MSIEKVVLRGRAAVVAGVCHALGFRPSQSLVVLTLCGDRDGMGPVMRVDLPTNGFGPASMPSAVHRVVDRYADAVVIIVFCQDTSRGRVHALAAARELGLITQIRDVLYATASTVGSYQDDSPPRSWSMRDAPDALLITGGRRVLASREAVCSQLDPSTVGAPVHADQLDDAVDEMSRLQPAQLAENADRLYRKALAAAAYGRPLPEDLSADLLVALDQRPVRDAVLCTALADIASGHATEVLAALTLLVGRAPNPWVAGPAAVLAAAAYRSGDGALAAAALDRVLAVDPAHLLARLLFTASQECLPPSALDALIPAPLIAP